MLTALFLIGAVVVAALLLVGELLMFAERSDQGNSPPVSPLTGSSLAT